MKSNLKRILKKSLPKCLYDGLKKFKNILPAQYSVESYSQEGEDMVLRSIFLNKDNGFYVDVGAHHPFRFSNTYYFYKNGWRGINIDAMPGSMKLFKIKRPRDINIEKAVSDKKEIMTYYVFNEPAINGFSKEISEERNNRGEYHVIDRMKLEATTLNEILEKYLPKNQKIDFISIDVEGFDLKVLRSWDLKRFRPGLILIEILGKEIQDIINGEVAKYLESMNYSFYAKTGNTVFFREKI